MRSTLRLFWLACANLEGVELEPLLATLLEQLGIDGSSVRVRLPTKSALLPLSLGASAIVSAIGAEQSV